MNRLYSKGVFKRIMYKNQVVNVWEISKTNPKSNWEKLF